MDGVRAGHERRVERGRNPPDQLDAEEDREQEDIDPGRYAVIHPFNPYPIRARVP